jgi:aryl-phospho-beta-D-glucosidase BglC (GH1 family)
MNWIKLILVIPFFACFQPSNRQSEKSSTPADTVTAISADTVTSVPDKNGGYSKQDVSDSKNHSNSKKSSLASVKSSVLEVDPGSWRGVNLPLQINWDTKNSLSQSDFDYAAAAGANVIRLSVHADNEAKNHSKFINANGTIIDPGQNSGLADLSNAVGMAEKAGLKVIIDMHSVPGQKGGKIWMNAKYWNILSNIWVAVAEKFKGSSTVVAFDLMNEPGVVSSIQTGSGDVAKMFKGTWSPPQNWKGTARDYNLHIANLIRAIRKTDPDRYVIVEGFGYLGNPINFNWMKPVEGIDKIIYSFHMYIPTGLTMLGTKGSEKKGNDEKIQPFRMPQDEDKIDKAFAPVLAFQKKYNVPIFVGEFGVTDEAIFGKNENDLSYNGACWLSTVIKKMDENKWGWTYWDFWTDRRKPDSKEDPRYVILSAAMRGEPVKDYCR